MKTARWRMTASAALVAALLATSACSNKAKDSGGSGGGGELKTGPGVTADTISLGVLTDLSGVFKVGGSALTDGEQIWADEVNAAGGICNRKIKLEIKDHGYDPQKAVGLYTDLAPNVLAMAQMLGSPVTSALKQNVTTDDMLTWPGAWASTLLDNKNNFIVGATYDVEMINAIAWLMKEKGVKAGDKIGHIYVQGEYGANGKAGSTYAAGKAGVTVVPAEVTATAADLTSQVTSLKNEGVKAILLSTTPTQTASAAGVDAAIGLNVPLVGDLPTFVPQLLASAAGPAIEKLLYISQSTAPIGTSDAVATKVLAAEKAKHADAVPWAGHLGGYAAGTVIGEILKKACDNKDLTRAGLQTALRAISPTTAAGTNPTLTYSKVGQLPTLSTRVLSIDKSVPGALKEVSPLAVSDLVKDYKGPAGG